MKFILTPDSWEISEMDPIEWTFLNRIPEMATGAGLPEETRRRLLPDPIDVTAGEREAEEGFLEDWDEYVRPDLDSAFQAARDQVGRDLSAAEAEEGLEGEVDSKFPSVPVRVRVARAASDGWYSALNQARLLMNEVYDLAEASESHQWPGAGDDEKESESQGPPTDGARLVLLAQYEFYTALQSILIEVMSRNDQEASDSRDDPDE